MKSKIMKDKIASEDKVSTGREKREDTKKIRIP